MLHEVASAAQQAVSDASAVEPFETVTDEEFAAWNAVPNVAYPGDECC